MNNLPKPHTRIAADIDAAKQRLTEIEERLPKEYRDALDQLNALKDGIDIMHSHAEQIAEVMPKLTDAEKRRHRQTQFLQIMKAHASGHALILLTQSVYAELHLMKRIRVDQIRQSLGFQSELLQAQKEIQRLNEKVLELQNQICDEN